MKRFVAIILILSVIAIIAVPAPANAGGNKGLIIGGALLGGFLLGSVLNNHDRVHDRVIVGPVYPPYPPPVYYPPPVVYQPQLVWIPDHYEMRWQKNCEVMYQYPRCYLASITVFIPGHWEYR